MGLFGRTSLATAVINLALLGTNHSIAAVEVAQGGGSHESIWKSTDVGLYLDDSLEELPDAIDSVNSALEIWSSDSRLPHVWPLFGSTDAIGYREGQNNRNTIRFADGGEPRAKGALAITIVSYESDEETIVDGDIVINGLYCFGDLRQSGKTSGSSSKRPVYDLTDVLLHELGHWFGLADDVDDPRAVMYPYFDAGATRALSLGDGDRRALDALYSSNTEQAKGKPGCSIAVHGHGDASYILVLVTVGGLGCWRRQRRRLLRHEH